MAIDTEPSINIRNLVLEDPKKELSGPFLPSRDILESDWAAIRQLLAGSTYTEWRRVMATGVGILDPKKLEGIDLSREIEDLKAYLKIELGSNPLSPDSNPNIAVLERLFQLKVLDPQAFKDLRINHNPNQWPSLARSVKNWSSNISGYGQYAKYFVLTAPPDVHLNREEETGRELLLFCRPNKALGGWDGVLNTAANLKIVFPDQIEQLNLNEEFWNHFKDEMSIWREESLYWSTFVETALNLAFLSASNIRSDESGIHLDFNPQDSQIDPETSLQPERRKF